MNPSIAIIGKGTLANLVSEQLASTCILTRWETVEQVALTTESLALVLHDSWLPKEHSKADELSIPWLRGFVSFGEAIIGPLLHPQKVGCSYCMDIRFLMTGPDRRESFMIKEYKCHEQTTQSDCWASTTGLLHTAYLINNEIQQFLTNETTTTDDHLLLINLNTLKTTRHFVLPMSSCPVCSQLPLDSPALATISLQPCPKTSLDSYRCRSLDDLTTFLAKDYLDFRTGIFNNKQKDLVSPFADTVINLPLLTGNEGTAGRTHSYRDSEAAAILEGLERFCGYAPRGKRTVVHSSYQHLAHHALNPTTIGVHSKEQYSLPAFPFQVFDPHKPIHWVWGYSLLHEEPILIPEALAYYSLGGGDSFVYETSNGCALGGSLEEAILYGIFEIVERDSFLMAWYGRLTLPRLDILSTKDKELLLMVQRLQITAGFDVYLYNSTTENGIPSIWAMAKNRKDKGLNLLCAAGAHLDPIKAAKASVQELAGMLLTTNSQLDKNKKKYMEMYHDSSLVQQMDDHAMLYGLKESEERLSFLLDNERSTQTFQEAFTAPTKRTDLLEDLQEVLAVFKKLNLSVLVVNQTSPELERNSLHCVKVIIPGMLPMTFGHHLTRLTGLARALTVPVKMGYYKKPLTPNELNPYPHPFP